MKPSPFRNSTEIASLHEDQLRRKVIMPLLIEMGFNNVIHNHGAREFGKDIVAFNQDAAGDTYCIAIVAKAGKLSGRKVNEVRDQIEKAFNSEFANPIDNSVHKVKDVWVVAGGDFHVDTIAGLRAMYRPEVNGHIKIWSGADLWEKWERYFSTEYSQLIGGLQAFAAKWSDEAVAVRIQTEPGYNSIEWRVTDASQLVDRHTMGQISFKLPKSDEGAILEDQVERFFKFGDELVISDRFVSVEMPAAYEDAMQDVNPITGETTWTLSCTSRDLDQPLRVIISNDVGNSVELPYIDVRWIQGGTEEVTIRNDTQPIPIRLQLTIPTGQFRFSIDGGRVPAHWLVRWEELTHLLREPGRVEFWMVTTGQRLASAPRTGIESFDPSPQRLRLYRDLEGIGTIVGDVMNIDLDEFTDEDWSVSNILRTILHAGTLELKPWETCILSFSDENANQILEEFGDRAFHPIELNGSDSAILQGQTLDLGPTVIRHTLVRLADNQPSSRTSPTGDTIIDLQFVAGDENSSTIQYLNWLPEQGDR